ncbi:MAG: UDP-N-acetylglucosamine 2-epimerase (non-hydrolyzing) [Pseudomonadota bacterium]
MPQTPRPAKISVIFGTRPEAIKLAPVILRLQQEAGLICHVCSSSQHRQMLDQVLEVFDIRPDADLDLMRPNQTLSGLTARAIEAIDGYLAAEKPDLVLVQGDTTTVFCASLAAFYRHVPIGHVEAGLRTGDLTAPWPEEANRVLTSRLARLHFAPTATSRENLLREGIGSDAISVTGNTVIDALFIAAERVRQRPPSVAGLPAALQPTAAAAGAEPKMVLITGHRRENFGGGFESICRAIAELAGRFPDVHFVYPVHLNPNVRGPVRQILGATDGSGAANLHLIEPLPYLSFVGMMSRSTLILTDSGGVQEEAPSLGKPVLVMRAVTERPEAVAAGTVRLVGTDQRRIVDGVTELLTQPEVYEKMSRAHNPYGDGHAAERIVALCKDLLARAPAQPGG